MRDLTLPPEFEPWLADWLASRDYHPRLRPALVAAVLDGGKRFRALLALIATELAGRPVRDGFTLAGAVELIHAYSLVHDDLPAMDNAELRRGKPTIHKRFGETLAILVGDALLSEAFALVTETEADAARVTAAAHSLATAATAMVNGQVGDILDLETATSVMQVAAIHRGKTGALIEWSLNAPLAVWSDDTAMRSAVAEFAARLGVLYQVRDDLLDVDPDAVRDKDRNADGAKSTYARLLGVDTARAYAEAELDACRAALAPLEPQVRTRLQALAEWTVARRQ